MSARFDWAIHHTSLMLVLLPWLSSMGAALWLEWCWCWRLL
jgi:hypothetical protein